MGVHIPGELGQHLTEGQVRVAGAGLGIALPHGHHQARVSFLCPAGELGDQSRFAAAGLADHKAHLTSSGQCLVEKLFQLGHFALARHKHRFGHRFVSLALMDSRQTSEVNGIFLKGSGDT